MCYDIAFMTSIKTIEDYFPGIKVESQLELGFHDIEHVQAQGNMSFGIIVNENDILTAEHMLWAGMVNQRRDRVYNARTEGLLDKKSFWYRYRHNRCLIPVTGIYEHRGIEGWKKKVPYYVRQKNRNIFFLPGLYDDGNIAVQSTGEVPRTFTMLTRKGNSVMEKIHNADPGDPRMPLFLSKELEREWLSPALTEAEMQQIFDFEISPDDLEYYPVFTIRSPKPRPDDKTKTEPYEWPKLPPLFSSNNNFPRETIQH